MPETNRRAVLGAVLAAGAIATKAVLPAAASEPQLSAVDRRVLDLWRRHQRVKAFYDRLGEECDAQYDRLPSWAQSGPVYLRPDGSDAGMNKVTGWPLVADLSRRPIVNGVINSRPSAMDLCTEFLAAVNLDRTSSTHGLARSLHELSDRLRQKDAEQERVGLTRSESRLQSACGVMNGIELKFEELALASVLAFGAVLILEIEADDDEEKPMRRSRAALAAIRLRLVGALAEAADRVLAQEGEDA